MKLKVPINKIPLPDKAYTCKFECVDIGFNRCLNELEQCVIQFDEEKLVELLYDESIYDEIGSLAPRKSCLKIAKAIINSMPEILSIKKGIHE